MVGENKILTVSYGTFSCTLEGFDDPFSTMKAIAEYFRDLAAEDRFFGAEPPQPDADMLHRIAENTVQSRVAAEVSDNSVVLRQDGRPTSTLAAPLAASAAQPAPEPVAQPAPMPAAEPVVEPASAAPFAGDSIAAKLQRIRSVVAQEAEITEQTAPFYSEDEHADAVPVKAASAPVDLSVTEETPDEQADVENAEATADSVEADSTAEDAADEVTDTDL
ncbi:MAG: hypothetical protein OXD48_02810, partial [Litoreibacter sp.]|nr:hypothetical protein [Litoreibacter sp.]